MKLRSNKVYSRISNLRMSIHTGDLMHRFNMIPVMQDFYLISDGVRWKWHHEIQQVGEPSNDPSNKDISKK